MLIELPQEKLLRKHGYTLADLEMLKRRVYRYQKNIGTINKRSPGHIQAKAALIREVMGAK